MFKAIPERYVDYLKKQEQQTKQLILFKNRVGVGGPLAYPFADSHFLL